MKVDSKAANLRIIIKQYKSKQALYLTFVLDTKFSTA